MSNNYEDCAICGEGVLVYSSGDYEPPTEVHHKVICESCISELLSKIGTAQPCKPKVYWICNECQNEYEESDIAEIHYNYNKFEPMLDAKAICCKCMEEMNQ